MAVRRALMRFGLAWSTLTSLARVRPPSPTGKASLDHALLGEILSHLGDKPLQWLRAVDCDLARYLAAMREVDPNDLSTSEALAFWINVYNAASLQVAATASRDNVASVMRLPGAFNTPVISVAGETLSLNDIEHGKVRRFGDPRVHAALVCGSVSCPTLRPEPFGPNLDDQLDQQMRQFLERGALVADRLDDRVVMSPIFSWFGGDFARSHHMPTLLPARRRQVLIALESWIDDTTINWIHATRPDLSFARYDWRLACTIG
ncbi:MAG: DUF547 domain-containing protein [Acidimicrobiia bacterium]